MDKLLELPKDGSFGASKLYRFQCDCLSAKDAMDIEVSEGPPSKKYFIISMNVIPLSLKGRIKDSWSALRGKWSWREFVVRSEDAKNLSDVFNPDIPYDDLP